MSQIFLVATTTSIKSLHAKTTSIESFKSGSEENKKQRSSVLSYRLRIQPLKLVLLEFQVENGMDPRIPDFTSSTQTQGSEPWLKDVKMVRVLVKNFLVSIIHLSIGSFNAPLPGQPTGIWPSSVPRG